MLRLPPVRVVSPTDVAGVVAALAQPGARLLAGGTDLLPNLKHRLEQPELLVSLHAVEALRTIEVADGSLHLGAGARLSEIATHPEVSARWPSLAEAAGLVAGPQIRNTATIGGNVNLDTRCRYVNQSDFWRSAIGGCLKAEGDVCHVVPKGRRCVAALSSDCVPVLISLEAQLELVGPDGLRTLPVADYFHADGVAHTVRQPAEVTTRMIVPALGPSRTRYVKWRPRGAIDFPLVSVAIRFDLEHDAADARVERAVIVAGVLGAKPRVIRGLEVAGLTIAECAVPVAEKVFAQCKPLANVPYEVEYRRHLYRVLTRRAVESLAV